MKQTFLPLALFIFSLCSQLWAAPATVENNDYKVTLSETLPGIDAGGALLMPGAGVTLTVADKFRSQQILYPLQGYAVPNDFLLGDTLNLILRTTLINTPSSPRYNFIQLDLSNPSDSHQFSGLSQYSFSPDRQNILLVVDKGEGAPWLGLSQLTGNPLSMQWLYAEGAGINLFKAAFQGPVTGLTVNNPVGWSADSLSAAFLLSVDDGTRDGQSKPVMKDYLAFLEFTDKGWKAAAQAVDLSPYHFHTGAALTDLRYDGSQAKLFFTSDNSTNPIEADFKPNTP